jgi:hypothetical protein
MDLASLGICQLRKPAYAGFFYLGIGLSSMQRVEKHLFQCAVFCHSSPPSISDRSQMFDKLPQCRQRISIPAGGIDLRFLSALDHVASSRPQTNRKTGISMSRITTCGVSPVVKDQKHIFDSVLGVQTDPRRRVSARAGGNAVRKEQ